MLGKLAAPLTAFVLGAAGSYLVFGPDTPAYAQMGHGMGMHDAHDEVMMPGLRGENASEQESAELAIMFRNFQSIERTVENLPDGIRTVTGSSDPEVFATLVGHVTGMIKRVEDGQDPKIFIQSPTLDAFFLNGDAIETDIEVTKTQIIVTQTSDDPEMVAALQTHAAEVTEMADRGMAAVHDRMMGQQ